MDLKTKEKKQSERLGVDAVIFAAILFIQIPVQYVWNMQSSFAYTFFIAISSFGISVKHINISGKRGTIAVMLYVLMLIFLFTSIVPITPFAFLKTMLVNTILLLDTAFIKKVFKAFTVIFSIMMIPSMIEYISVEYLGVNLPSRILDSPYLTEDDITFYAYYFHVNATNNPIEIFPRFSSMFDEPGVVGTFASIILCCQHMNMKRIWNIPILVAGILSFSLFFYAIIILYIVLFHRSPLFKIVFSVLLISGAVWFIEQDNEMINKYIINRLELDDQKGFSGNNRTAGDFDQFYQTYKHSSDALFGLGRGSKLIYDDGGASYKDRILEYGYVGFGLYMILMISYSLTNYKGKKKLFLISLFLFISNIWQRPFIDFHSYMAAFLFILSCIESIEISGPKMQDVDEYDKIVLN